MKKERTPYQSDAMDFREFCQRLHISQRKGREIIASRQIAVARVGRRVLVTESALSEYLQRNTVPAIDATVTASRFIGG